MFFVVANTVLRSIAGALPPPVSKIWNLVTTQWENDTDTWN